MQHRSTVIAVTAAGLILVGSGALAVRVFSGGEGTAADDRPTSAEVKRVVNGHTIKVEPDEKVCYAGIRAPYEGEPLHREAMRRNAELVEGETVRLRFDEQNRDKKGRMLAYVFADGRLVNEILVREGLAYVRLTPDTRRYTDRLLDAQHEARIEECGVWELDPPQRAPEYTADPKYGNFHRPGCEEVPKIKPARRVVFKDRSKALDAGFAPCCKCLP